MAKRRITIPEFRALLEDAGYKSDTVTRKRAKKISAKYNVNIPTTLYDNPVVRGVFALYGEVATDVNYLLGDAPKPTYAAPEAAPAQLELAPVVLATAPAPEPVSPNYETRFTDIANSFPSGHFIPRVDPFYVKWSSLHNDLENILKSGKWCPSYITGLSGNGKTMTPTQIGAGLKREVIRVNFTSETSEDDLLGSFRLINGETVWEDGPVVIALKRGAILILDELDLGGERIMCLQSVLEGNGVYVKKVNRHIYPKEGFNVVATGNTKGKGDDGHGFMFTNFLNEAMLDRFTVTFEQEYPSIAVETKILSRAYSLLSDSDNEQEVEYFDKLAKTGALIREDYIEGGIDGLLSTRRLVDIVKTYTIFGDKVKAFELCTNRFDKDTAGGMMTLYKAVDSGAHSNNGQADELSPVEGSNESEPDIPF